MPAPASTLAVSAALAAAVCQISQTCLHSSCNAGGDAMQEKIADLLMGSFFAIVGTTGAAFHIVTSIGNGVVIVLNVILALCGIYLMWLRTKKTRGEIADDERDRADRDKRRETED